MLTGESAVYGYYIGKPNTRIASRGSPIIQRIWMVRKTHVLFKMLTYVRRRVPTPDYDGFNLEAKVLKPFDGVRQEPTCSIHVTWATDSVMGLDCLPFLHWRARTTCVSFLFTTSPPTPSFRRTHTNDIKKKVLQVYFCLCTVPITNKTSNISNSLW